MKPEVMGWTGWRFTIRCERVGWRAESISCRTRNRPQSWSELEAEDATREPSCTLFAQRGLVTKRYTCIAATARVRVAAFDRRVILHCCADVHRRSLLIACHVWATRRALCVVFSRLDEGPVAPTRTCHKLLTRSAHAFIQNTRCSCPANVATIHQASAFPNVRRVCLFAAACLRLFSARRFCPRCGLCRSVLRDPRSVVIVSSDATPLGVSAAVPILPLKNRA